MSDKPNDNDGPLSRWSRRKTAARKEREASAAPTTDPTLTASLAPNLEGSDGLDNAHLPVESEQGTATTDNKDTSAVEPEVELPDIDSLNEDSDYSAFMAPNVSTELRNLALRKLFKSSVFNIRDGLDDYDEDFTTFEKLGDIVTSDMRHHAERKEKERLALEQEALEEDAKEDSVEQATDEQSTDETPTDLADQNTTANEPAQAGNYEDPASTDPVEVIRPTDADATLMSGKIRRRPNDPA